LRKGIEDLNKVISSMPISENVAFDFIGEIPMSKRIKRANVTYHGILKDAALIKDIMDQSDVLLVPSHSEGMPNVILEGMSRGLAVIATNVGAVRALVNNENGYLIEALDEAQLRSAIEKAVAAGHQDAFEKGSHALQMLNDRFGWDKIAEETEKQLAVRLVLLSTLTST
jgi:glycosyltransferase involved in cell wall biosynthesis